MPTRRALVALIVAVPIVASAAVAVVALAGGDGAPPAVEVSSEGPAFATLDELVAASDVVVVASVADVATGRVLTATDRADAGVRTRLLELVVERTLVGEPPDPLVVEEPAELLDGAPLIVDGMQPLGTGDRAIWFLVAGGTAELPYHAVVNAQGRYDVVGATLDSAADDPLARELAALGPEGLAAAVEEIAGR